MNARPVDMANSIHQLFSYHPAAVMGSLLAGGPIAGVARQDAEPLPEPAVQPVRKRLVSLLRRPRPAAA